MQDNEGRLTGLLTSFRRKGIAGGRGKRRKLLMHDLKEKRKYWELQALVNTVCKSGFARGYSHVARQTRQ